MLNPWYFIRVVVSDMKENQGILKPERLNSAVIYSEDSQNRVEWHERT